MPDEKNNQKADMTTKLMFGVLSFIGMMTLILGVLNIGQMINLQNNYGGGQEPSGITVSPDKTEKSVEELKTTDTDGDGLSDFDELYIYNTSPYLTDSDSDGYSDKQEIDQGYDPNCPKGQDCRGGSTDQSVNKSTDQATTQGAVNQGTTGQGSIDQSVNKSTDQSGVLPADAQAQLEKLTPDQVRQMLKDSGNLTAEQAAQIDQIDDETLMQIFRETLNQNTGSN